MAVWVKAWACHRSYVHLSGLSRHKKDCKAAKSGVKKDRGSQQEPVVVEEVIVQSGRHTSWRRVPRKAVSSGPSPTLLAMVGVPDEDGVSDDDTLTPTLVLAARWPTIVCPGDSIQEMKPWQRKKRTMPLTFFSEQNCFA